MTKLSQGLYYTLLTEALQEELRKLDPELVARSSLHHAEVADRIAMHVARIVERAISGISDSDHIAGGIELARSLIDCTVQQTEDEDLKIETVIAPRELLTATQSPLPDPSH
jgi:hypothetical protein